MKFLRHHLILWALCAVSATAVYSLAAPTASATDVFNGICHQAGTTAAANGSPVCHTSGANNISGPNGIIIKVANIFAFIGGVASVIVIMIGGFMYITSGGDAGKANSGRSAVTYAVVGLVVIVLGRAIIGFVMSKF